MGQPENAFGLRGTPCHRSWRSGVRLCETCLCVNQREQATEARRVQERPSDERGGLRLQPHMRLLPQAWHNVSVHSTLQFRYVQNLLQGAKEENKGEAERVVGETSRGRGQQKERQRR